MAASSWFSLFQSLLQMVGIVTINLSHETRRQFITAGGRLTCCFPKGSVASFLLETQTAVL